MIRVTDLTFSFADKQIFSNLSFTVKKGEILSIIGPNGCGKSTLLRLLRGNLQAAGGEICWNSTPLAQLTTSEIARKVAVVPQSSTITFPYTVRELVAMGRYPHRHSILAFENKNDLKIVEQAMIMADILPLAQRRITQLSGGEAQRVLLARALAQSSSVLFLDEASSHLDIDHRLDLTKLLVKLQREQNTTIVQISHDLDLAASISTRIMLLRANGTIVAIDTPEKVMTEENLRQVFRFQLKITRNQINGAPQITPLLNS